MSRRQRILIAHSGKFFGSTIWSMIVPEPEFEIVGIANNIEEAVNMASNMSPDLILVDLSDTEVIGLQTIHTLYALYPFIPVIAFVPVWANEYTKRALDAGATTCLTESDLADVLLQKLQNLLPTRPFQKSLNYGGISLPNS